MKTSGRNRSRRLILAGIGLISLVVLLHVRYCLSVTLGRSMLPTLRTGDLLLVDKLAYRNAEPQRDDIVVARDGEGLIVKRIVGLPGEEVEVKLGVVYIHHTPLAEQDYVAPGELDITAGHLLPGRFAVLGDNRTLYWTVHAVLPRTQIVGKVQCSFSLCPWVARQPPAISAAEPF